MPALSSSRTRSYIFDFLLISMNWAVWMVRFRVEVMMVRLSRYCGSVMSSFMILGRMRAYFMPYWLRLGSPPILSSKLNSDYPWRDK